MTERNMGRLRKPEKKKMGKLKNLEPAVFGRGS